MYLIHFFPRFVYLYIKYIYFFLFSKYCSCVYSAAKLCHCIVTIRALFSADICYTAFYLTELYNSAYLSQLVLEK